MEHNGLAFDNEIDLKDEEDSVEKNYHKLQASLPQQHQAMENSEVNMGYVNPITTNEVPAVSNDLSKAPTIRKNSMEQVQQEGSSLSGQSWMLPVNVFTDRNYPDVSKDKKLSRAARKFYRNQNEHISDCEQVYKDVIYSSPSSRELLLDTDDLHENEVRTNSNNVQHEDQKMASRLAKLSLCCNLILLCAKATAAGLSGSLAIISSLVDSAVDIASGVVVWATSRAVRRSNAYRYPQGRTRLEPAAIVVLSVIMAVASVQIILSSIQKIASLALDTGSSSCDNSTSSTEPPPAYILFGKLNLVVLSLVAATVILKIILYIICKRYGKTPAIEALAQDHRNDVIQNTAVFICTIISSLLWVYMDPVGAIVIGIYIVYTWSATCWEQIKVLTGYTADPAFLRLVTLIALNHHHTVKQVDTVRAFHHGTNYLVEVDIVLPEDMTVRLAHDVAETLQHKIELLENVERAFVHIDYEVLHNPRSEHKQV